MKTNKNNNSEEFFSLDFYIDSRVLIPRNETEIMVYQIIKEIQSPKDILIDVGTWSACIIIAVLKNIPFSLFQSFAFDISTSALEVAQINLNKHNLFEKVTLMPSDLLSYIFQNNLDLSNSKIIMSANLPYIKNNDLDNMDKDVYKNEPSIALFWWEKTGFEMYERLIWQIIDLKIIFPFSQFTLFIEIWFDQYDISQDYLQKMWLKFEFFKDFSNIWRIVKIQF